MSQIDIREATIRLYEDYTLTEGYDEAQAGIIHQWSEAQIQLIAHTAKDEDNFEKRYSAMRNMLKMINRYITQRANLDDEKHRNYIRLLIERAQEAGYPPKPTAVADVVSAVNGLDDSGTIRALLALVETGAASSAGALPRAAASPDKDSGEDEAPDDVPDDVSDDMPDIDSDTVLFTEEELAEESDEDTPRENQNGWKTSNPFKRTSSIDDIPGSDRK